MKEQAETLTKTQITIMAQRASLRAFQKETLEKLISHEYSMKDAMAHAFGYETTSYNRLKG